MCLFVLMFLAPLPVMAADNAMKDDMKMGAKKESTMKKDAMMTSATMEKKNMAADTMEKSMAMGDTRTAMLAGADGHNAAGKVKFTQKMGRDILVLSDIKVDKVPDGYVYLAKQGDRKMGIRLGMLKQFSGDVAFKLPEGTDPKTYDSVVIYCEEFDVEIGRAEFDKKM